MKSKSLAGTGFLLNKLNNDSKESLYEDLVSGSYRAQQEFFK